MTQSVTLDGDVVDPQGTLSGGSRPSGNPVLLEVGEIQEIRRSLDEIENELRGVQQQINQLQKVAQTFNQTKEQLDLCQHELNLVKGRLAKSSFEQHQQEIDELAARVGKLCEKYDGHSGEQKIMLWFGVLRNFAGDNRQIERN